LSQKAVETVPAFFPIKPPAAVPDTAPLAQVSLTVPVFCPTRPPATPLVALPAASVDVAVMVPVA